MPIPRQVLWRGHEAFASALELVAAAEAAAQAAAAQPAGSAVAAAAAPPIEGAAPPPALPFVWRRGLVRPAASAKQAADFARATAGLPEGIGPRALTAEELRVRGLAVPGACRQSSIVTRWLTTPSRTLRVWVMLIGAGTAAKTVLRPDLSIAGPGPRSAAASGTTGAWCRRQRVARQRFVGPT